MSPLFGSVVVPAGDRSAAAWVQERFDWQLVNCAGFSGYLRIDHSDADGADWIGSSFELAGEIAEVVVNHTSTPERALFAIWEGHGWTGTSVDWAELRPLPTRAASVIRRRWRQARDRRRQTAVRRGLDEQLSVIPSFELPLRRYYLLAGPVSAAAGIRSPADGGEPQAPDLWWPDDRSWFVGTDTDLDFTVVGGSDALIAELAAAMPERSRRWQGRAGQDDGEGT